MTIEELNIFLERLSKEKFTGKIVLNLHDGNISKDIKKEVVECIEVVKSRPMPANIPV